MSPLAGVDIGGTKIAVALDHLTTDLLIEPTPRGATAILKTVVRMVRAATGAEALDGVGVGSAGTFDQDGRVVAATDLIPGWAGTEVAALLMTELGIPVVALNDVHATGLGEATAGAGSGVGRVLVAAVGTGLGGAFVIDGAVDLGNHGTAGSLGHIALPGLDRRCSCGKIGHAEPIASGPGIERAFATAGGPRLALPAIGDLARAGDKRALAAIEAGGRTLGRALAVAATLHDPDLIVIGGGAAQLGDIILDPARAAYGADVATPLETIRIVPAALGSRAAIVGAHTAIRHVLARKYGPDIRPT